MVISFYLLIGSSGGIELRKTLPRQQRMDRVAIKVNVTLSDTWFRRPIPTIALSVPDADVLPLPAVVTEAIEESE